MLDVEEGEFELNSHNEKGQSCGGDFVNLVVLFGIPKKKKSKSII